MAIPEIQYQWRLTGIRSGILSNRATFTLIGGRAGADSASDMSDGDVVNIDGGGVYLMPSAISVIKIREGTTSALPCSFRIEQVSRNAAQISTLAGRLTVPIGGEFILRQKFDVLPVGLPVLEEPRDEIIRRTVEDHEARLIRLEIRRGGTASPSKRKR